MNRFHVMVMMKHKIHTLFVVLGILICPTHGKLFSQERFPKKHKYEIGTALGASTYIGDANPKNPFLYPGMAGGLLFRFNPSMQWTLKANILGGRISGDTNHSGNRFPGDRHDSFQRAILDVGAQVEFHFFRFGTEQRYLGTRPFTPYLFTGTGVTMATGKKPMYGINVPLGFGFKFICNNRVNIGVEASMRKLFRDDVDVTKAQPEWSLDAPFGIKGSLLKNQDWYAFALLYMTWDFGLRDNPCR